MQSIANVFIFFPDCIFWESCRVEDTEEDGGRESNRDIVERESETQRERTSERCFCCNVMLNSNMNCSHHGNGLQEWGLTWCRECVFAVCVLAHVGVRMHVQTHTSAGTLEQIKPVSVEKQPVKKGGKYSPGLKRKFVSV